MNQCQCGCGQRVERRFKRGHWARVPGYYRAPHRQLAKAGTYQGKQGARMRVRVELRAGRMLRPDRCEECSEPARVEAHHEDYDKPLSVRWLCKACHIDADRVVRASPR